MRGVSLRWYPAEKNHSSNKLWNTTSTVVLRWAGTCPLIRNPRRSPARMPASPTGDRHPQPRGPRQPRGNGRQRCPEAAARRGSAPAGEGGVRRAHGSGDVEASGGPRRGGGHSTPARCEGSLPAPEGLSAPPGVRGKAGRALPFPPFPASLRRRGRGRAAGRSPRREVVMVSRVTCVRGSPGAGGGGRRRGRGGFSHGRGRRRAKRGAKRSERLRPPPRLPGSRCPPRIRLPFPSPSPPRSAPTCADARPFPVAHGRSARARLVGGLRTPGLGLSPLLLLLSPSPLPPPSQPGCRPPGRPRHEHLHPGGADGAAAGLHGGGAAEPARGPAGVRPPVLRAPQGRGGGGQVGSGGEGGERPQGGHPRSRPWQGQPAAAPGPPRRPRGQLRRGAHADRLRERRGGGAAVPG